MKTLLAILGCLVGLTGYSENRVPNSSFEVGSGRGWITWRNSGGGYAGNTNDIKGSITNASDSPHGGYSLILNPGGFYQSRMFWLNAGTYKTTLKARRLYGSGATSFAFGLLNGGNLDTFTPALPCHTTVSTTTWVSLTNTFVASSNAFYTIGGAGDCGGSYAPHMLVDSIQVEETTATDYAPSATVELGIQIPITNNIFFVGDTPKFHQKLWNNGTASNILTMYEVRDLWNRVVASGSNLVALASGTNTTVTNNLPADYGWFRILTRLPQVKDSYDEAAYANYPFALDLRASTTNDFYWGEANSSPYSSDLENKKGRYSTRVVSASAAWRWNVIEPTEGNFNWTDAHSTLTTLLSGGRKLLIPLSGADEFWQSASVRWATNGAGVARFSAFTNYVAKVALDLCITNGLTNDVYFEIWNEPYQSGPQTPGEPINLRNSSNYTVLLQWTIRALTNVSPNIKIVAMGGSNGDVNWPFAVWNGLNAGEKAAIHAVSVHEYTENQTDPNIPPQGTANTPDNWMYRFGGIVPVWNTESGSYMRSQGKGLNNMYPAYFQFWLSPSPEAGRDEPQLRQRVQVSRAMGTMLSDIGEGYWKLMYYDSRQWNTAAYSDQNTFGYAADQLWVDKPDKVAMSVASKKLMAPGLGRITNSLARMYLFKDPSGNPVVAAWSWYRTNLNVTLTNSFFATKDIYWNQLGTNQFTVVLQSVPRYFYSTTLTTNQLRDTFKFAGIALGVETNIPYISLDVAPTAPWNSSDNPALFKWATIHPNLSAWPVGNAATNLVTRWQIDSDGWSGWSQSNHVWMNLTDGNHTFYVEARDRFGNTNSMSYQLLSSAPTSARRSTSRIFNIGP